MLAMPTRSTDLPAIPEIPPDGSEREMLEAFLDVQRTVMVRKVVGLSDADAGTAACPPSTMSLLGMLRHLAYVERYWFRRVVAGHDVEFPDWEHDIDVEWRIAPEDTVDAIVDLYLREVAAARRAVSDIDLETEVLNPDRDRGRDGLTLRWVFLHMIEETARHAGHADLLRERLDGATGD